MKQVDIDVAVHDGSLVVRGEKHSERKESGKTYFFSEREFGYFQRTFRLPPDADHQHIDAAYGDGVLNIKIAKRGPEKDGQKRIEIRQV